MRRPARSGRALALALLLMAAGPVPPARAAEKLEDHFTRDWFYTEVVVFLRSGVHDYTSSERLATPAAPVAASLRSFLLPPEERWSRYRLAPLTRAHLAFPYLDASRLDLFAGPEEDPLAGEFPADAVLDEDAGAPGVPPPIIEPRLAPDPLLTFLRDLAAFEANLQQQSYRPLSEDTFTLTRHANALARRGGYRILLHRRWLQPVPAREHPQPLLVQVGPRHGDTFALEGTLEVTRGRYLHFGAHLLYVEPLLGQAPLDRALPPPSPERTRTGPLRPPLALSLDDLEPAGFMQLRENRRVSEEMISYFDHPKLGVLVSIQAVVPPPALAAAHKALEEEENAEE